MMTYPICFSCKNHTKDLKCKAFPKGIPLDIINGKNKHTTPLKNQKNDVVFEEID
jgi:hypothetical protein